MREAHRTGFTTSKFRRVEQTRDRPDACNVALRSYLRFAEIQFNISIAITLATLFVYVVILRPPGLPCPVMGALEIRILSKILSATLGKWIFRQKNASVSNLVSLT